MGHPASTGRVNLQFLPDFLQITESKQKSSWFFLPYNKWNKYILLNSMSSWLMVTFVGKTWSLLGCFELCFDCLARLAIDWIVILFLVDPDLRRPNNPIFSMMLFHLWEVTVLNLPLLLDLGLFVTGVVVVVVVVVTGSLKCPNLMKTSVKFPSARWST